jgi:hypothetical protein
MGSVPFSVRRGMATNNAEAYYREQAERFRKSRQRDRGVASSSRGTAHLLVMAKLAQVLISDMSRTNSIMEPGEAVARRPVARPVPLYSSYYAHKPAPLFKGLRYHIHKTTPSHIFGWLRSLLIVRLECV